MPITYPLVMPDGPGFVEFKWTPDSAVVVQHAQFTYNQKVIAWDGQIRRATVTTGRMRSQAQARSWMAFLLKLNGREGTFLMQDPANNAVSAALEALQGSYTARVDGGSQIGHQLISHGWPVSLTPLLRAGDFISIGGTRLHTVLDDTNSSGAGTATINVWPFLDGTIAHNTALWVGDEAYGVFRLTEYPEHGYDLERIMEGIQFSCEEAI